MIAKKLVLPFLILIMIAFNSFGNEQLPKKVECKIEIMPNYIWHLFAAANIWNIENSKYASLYGKSIPDDDKELLFTNRELLSWGNGIISKFTPLLFFIPFSQEITPNQYWDYLEITIKTMKSNSWDNFADQYCPSEKNRIVSFQFTNDDINKFIEIKNVIKRNFSIYENTIWDSQKKYLIDEKNSIDLFFAKQDIIKAWEQKLDIAYNADGFYPVLTYANGIDNLVSANNLSTSRNNFAVSIGNTNNTIDLMIHEIGIFTLWNTIMVIYSDPLYQTTEFQKTNVVYQAVESYIEIIKGKITGSMSEWEGKMYSGESFEFGWFFNFYKDKIGTYRSEKLIREAIIEFSKARKKT